MICTRQPYVTKAFSRELMVRLGEMYPAPRTKDWENNISRLVEAIQTGPGLPTQFGRRMSREGAAKLLRVMAKEYPYLAWRKKDANGKPMLTAFHSSVVSQAIDYLVKNINLIEQFNK